MNTNLFKILFLLCGLLMFQAWIVSQHSRYFGSNFEFAKSFERKETQSALNTFNDVEDDNGNKSISNQFGETMWRYVEWMPDIIEDKFFQVSIVRKNTMVIGGNTQIDKDVKMESIIDFLMYVPRAFQVGMFSPMPQFWSGEGSSPAMTMARKILGAATLFFYFCLVGLFLGAYRFWRSPAFWAIAVVCLSGILLYSFTHPNVGTLIRYRYGFYMLLVAFGAATIADGLLSRVKHK